MNKWIYSTLIPAFLVWFIVQFAICLLVFLSFGALSEDDITMAGTAGKLCGSLVFLRSYFRSQTSENLTP